MFIEVQSAISNSLAASSLPYLNKTNLDTMLQFTELCLGYQSFALNKTKVQAEYDDV